MKEKEHTWLAFRKSFFEQEALDGLFIRGFYKSSPGKGFRNKEMIAMEYMFRKHNTHCEGYTNREK
jgi:hypothetical protein